MEDLPAFEPDARARMRKRARLALAVMAALAAAIVATSFANRARWSLECRGETLVPRRGLLAPLGDADLDDPRYPPLPAPAQCRDERFDRRGTFEKRYVEIAVGRADAAVAAGTGDEAVLRDAASTLDAASRLRAAKTPAFERRQRAVTEALLSAAVERAVSARDEALRQLSEAQRAGLEAEVIRAHAQRLGLGTSRATPPAPSVSSPPVDAATPAPDAATPDQETSDAPAPAPPPAAEPEDDEGPRAL